MSFPFYIEFAKSVRRARVENDICQQKNSNRSVKVNQLSIIGEKAMFRPIAGDGKAGFFVTPTLYRPVRNTYLSKSL